MTYWKDKRVLITGGSSGMGFALATALSKSGARLVLAARNTERLHAAAERLNNSATNNDSKLKKKAESDILAVPADITKQDDVHRLFQTGLEWLGGLDMLINCAGKSDRGSVLDISAERLEELFDLNVSATVRCTNAALPSLLQSGGHLVNIGSLASKVATPLHGAYPATKFALAGYTQQLRLTLASRGVHVLLVCPGPIAQASNLNSRKGNKPTKNGPTTTENDNLGPGAGAKIKTLAPDKLATKILVACEKRKPELVVPAKARLLFTLSAISPRLGDWLLRRYISKNNS